MLVQYLTKRTSFFEQDAEFVLAVWDFKKKKSSIFLLIALNTSLI